MFKPGILTLTAAVLATCILSAPSSANVSQSDSSFVKRATMAGNGEIMAAQIAIQRGIDANVRSFAQRMITDHSQANRQLARIASRQGMFVPSGIDAADRAQIDRLRSLSGPAFDQAYSEYQVRTHRAAVALFSRESRNGRNTPLRQFASQTLPTLRMHQNMSYEVVASLQPTSSLMAHRRHHARPHGRHHRYHH